MAAASPFFRTLPLASHGLEWIEPDVMLAHPFDDGTAAVLFRSLDRTVSALGRDGRAYRSLLGSVADEWSRLERSVLAPPSWPRHPFVLARFGAYALRSAEAVARSAFTDERTRALFAGIAAHGMLPLDRSLIGGLRPRPGRVGARRRLVAAAWRRAVAGRCAGRPPVRARRPGGDRHADSLPRRAAASARRVVRPHAQAVSGACRPPPARKLSPPPPALSLRHGHVQSRLGARRTDSVAGR